MININPNNYRQKIENLFSFKLAAKSTKVRPKFSQTAAQEENT